MKLPIILLSFSFIFYCLQVLIITPQTQINEMLQAQKVSTLNQNSVEVDSIKQVAEFFSENPSKTFLLVKDNKNRVIASQVAEGLLSQLAEIVQSQETQRLQDVVQDALHYINQLSRKENQIKINLMAVLSHYPQVEELPEFKEFLVHLIEETYLSEFAEDQFLNQFAWKVYEHAESDVELKDQLRKKIFSSRE